MAQPKQQALYVMYKSPFNDSENGTQLVLDMQPWIVDGEDGLAFYDTGRGHMLDGKMTEETENGFTWTRNNGDVFKFREVTIQEFRHRIADTVVNGHNIADTIRSTGDLWEYYRKKFPV